MTIVLSLRDIPGPAFRRAIRHSLAERRPWRLIIDARTSPPATIDRLAMTLRLTRRAHRHGGEVVVVLDQATLRRAADAGLDRWLNVARTVPQARAMIAEQVARSA